MLEITSENTQGNFSKQVINKFDGFTCLTTKRGCRRRRRHRRTQELELKLKCWPGHRENANIWIYTDVL